MTRRRKEQPQDFQPLPLEKNDARGRVDFDGGTIFFSSHQGRRDTSEDRFLVQPIAVAPGQPAAFLKDIFTRADQRTRNMYPGTTATAALLTPDMLLRVAFVGDSPALLFVRNPMTGDVQVEKLTRDHHAYKADERRRVEKSGGEVIDGRVQGDLMLSRAFGDAGIRGVSRTPEHVVVDLKEYAAAGREVYLCLASDGIAERGIRPADYIPALRDALDGGREEELADIMTAQAFRSGSGDNITIVMMKAVPSSGKGGCFLAIADGHAGHEAAEEVISVFSQSIKGHAPGAAQKPPRPRRRR